MDGELLVLCLNMLSQRHGSVLRSSITCAPMHMRRIAEKLLKSSTGVRATGEPYSLFMTIWINLQIHDWCVEAEWLPKAAGLTRRSSVAVLMLLFCAGCSTRSTPMTTGRFSGVPTVVRRSSCARRP